MRMTCMIMLTLWIAAAALVAADPWASYLKGDGDHAFADVLSVSDGGILVTGWCDQLTWVPSGVPVVTIAGVEDLPISGTRQGVIIKFAVDQRTIEKVHAFPPGLLLNVGRIRTTSVPGEATGLIFVSGEAAREDGRGGYRIFKLDGNGVDRPITTIEWSYFASADGDHRSWQPWDVDGKGRVYCAIGKPFSYDWSAVNRLNADGIEDVVPDWHQHSGKNVDGSGVEVYGPAANAGSDISLTSSCILFKRYGGKRPILRSMSMADYTAILPDGNGGLKQGMWPDDIYYNSPVEGDDPQWQGPGYTGYKQGKNPTGRVVALVCDRRTNAFYFGYCYQSRLPAGQPDFEPAVVAMTETGALSWWSRLYSEAVDKNGNGQIDAGEMDNSTPDQYVDFLAIDYTHDQLVVGARCHGNNNTNFWQGDKIAAKPDAKSFKKQFTGSTGNIHISWIGKLAQKDGELQAATYVAEWADGMKGAGKPSDNPLLDGWPDPNGGWPEVNTTRLHDLKVLPDGSVAIVAVGRRVLTTSNAYQKMVKLEVGSSKWSDFVRVFTPDLSSVVYSSILTGTWDPATGAGGSGTDIKALAVTGAHSVTLIGEAAIETTKSGAKNANPMPTANLPAWGSPDVRDGRSAVMAVLTW